MLFLDEAHAVGVLGPNGRGLAAEQGLAGEIDVQMGTLSRALGVSGGYICGSRSLIEWLVNRARSFIFSIAPPPALAVASVSAIEFLISDEGEQRRQCLWRRINTLRASLPPNPGLLNSSSEGHEAGSAVHAWIVGDEQKAIDLARSLQSEGFLVPAIRYPTVAKGSARLRITVTAAHEEPQIHAFCAALARHADGSERP
jgi:7-keto-8-aminopelargonate synthetase-like enzyme